MPAYQIVMDDEGLLYIGTRVGRCPQWERLPLYGAGCLAGEPIDALAEPVLVPKWAVDQYLLFPRDCADLLGVAMYSV